ncbi:hypothetical protein TRSC58_07467 [Trypanosoma rangeli SC58]|uniref:Uncharacterized protein n=1 Tax=Trypanosoma rangeli SC58 TaxID=429131 RepID=A0A061IT39_TRYRA|nr:hypothetical protein TRSC58_07467 [Trypanosoma rangeli SC58]
MKGRHGSQERKKGEEKEKEGVKIKRVVGGGRPAVCVVGWEAMMKWCVYLRCFFCGRVEWWGYIEGVGEIFCWC